MVPHFICSNYTVTPLFSQLTTVSKTYMKHTRTAKKNLFFFILLLAAVMIFLLLCLLGSKLEIVAPLVGVTPEVQSLQMQVMSQCRWVQKSSETVCAQ